ncbi:MAG TPA: hypothetical protein VN922_01580 [Bacteroidia bacterium]|nr:hypothetical protein [Bacteroidia bacterium]
MFGTCTGRKASEEKISAELDEQRWLNDLQKLSNEELMRMYNTLSTGHYEFAKDAWYIPLEGDKRCPIMIAKGFKPPDSPQKMVEFQETAKILEQEYRRFIDAWDFGQITQHDLEKAILDILEARSIAIIELSH